MIGAKGIYPVLTPSSILACSCIYNLPIRPSLLLPCLSYTRQHVCFRYHDPTDKFGCPRGVGNGHATAALVYVFGSGHLASISRVAGI